MAVVEWDDDVMRSLRHFSLMLRAVNRSAGTSLRGRQQVLTTGEHVWQLRLWFGAETDQTRNGKWDAVLAQMYGQANVAKLRIPDPYGYPRRAPAPIPILGGVTVSGSYFAATGETATVSVVTGCAVGATQIVIGKEAATQPPLAVGEHFTYDDFLYRVVGVSGSTVDFLPKARTAIPDASSLQIDPLIVRARMTSDLGGEARRELGWIREPVTIDFVEAFDR